MTLRHQLTWLLLLLGVALALVAACARLAPAHIEGETAAMRWECAHKAALALPAPARGLDDMYENAVLRRERGRLANLCVAAKIEEAKQ